LNVRYDMQTISLSNTVHFDESENEQIISISHKHRFQEFLLGGIR